ncbi:putative MFS family arabinose efflux permease [Actinoplanes campanulatus]|uniref:Putative MFS family arabinose efflux permease n=1 Tax=Actinoplanes campanulatus TaxID=113559 RepID=A0A7W5AHH0_9ACTN|nr:MFS transporter [Actinoplanes campanulatus]MBB3096155.1 putative MFS family arabinose efflux permease [Actinoplanes campanulatus]GGN14156.1 MFS transporter [Actinoplanes campanulatus]GID36751.1 MFS transporter [Actinoplanes campanulatus]
MTVVRLLLATIAGTAIANNYAIQPALATVAADLGAGLTLIGLVPTAALAGCMAGFALLLPLTDRIAADRLVAAHLAVLATALTVAAISSHPAVLLAAYLVIGAAASVAAQAGVIAGRHAPAGQRTAAIATVAAGMSAGILLSRLAGGGLTDLLGWRWMLLVFAAVALTGAVAAKLLLPGSRSRASRTASPWRETRADRDRASRTASPWRETRADRDRAGRTASLWRETRADRDRAAGPEAVPGHGPRAGQTYAVVLAELPRQLCRHRALRWAVASGGLWYFAFHLVWVTLALALAPLGPTVIGLYSLAGLLGFAVLPYAGRVTDRFDPATVIAASLLIAITGATLLATGLDRPAVTASGLALLDAGLFAAQAANQSRIQALDPRHSGSLSSVYLVLYFSVGAVGAALAAPLLHTVGWRGTALVALTALLAALVVDQTAVRGERPQRLERDEPAPLQT